MNYEYGLVIDILTCKLISCKKKDQKGNDSFMITSNKFPSYSLTKECIH